MKIISSSGKGNFRLTESNKEICKLVYTNWFLGEAKTRLRDNEIEIKPKNIWTSKVDIYKNGKNIGDITFNLKGYMVIRLENYQGSEFNYVLKNNARWKLKFVLFDDKDVQQLSLNSLNNWSKLNYDYDIETADFNSEFDIEELLIYCGYAANLYLSVISAL